MHAKNKKKNGKVVNVKVTLGVQRHQEIITCSLKTDYNSNVSQPVVKFGPIGMYIHICKILRY